ncbi:hypothetical protein ACTBW4_10575 [Roseovarius pacificus]
MREALTCQSRIMVGFPHDICAGLISPRIVQSRIVMPRELGNLPRDRGGAVNIPTIHEALS